MKEIFSKKNLPLMAALAVPLLMILGLAAAVYLPGMGKRPAYNFLYMSGSGVAYSGYYEDEYFVKDGRLARETRALDQGVGGYYKPPVRTEVKFYIHDVKSNESREVGFDEAAQYGLDTASRSPDGYEVGRGGYSGGFLFFDGRSDYDHWYLRGYNRSHQLNLKLYGGGYYDNFKFLGWIKN